MKTKYTFLNEGIISSSTKHGIKNGLSMAGVSALAGTIVSGIGALLVRCKGNEELRKEELELLKTKIKVVKEKIQKLTIRMKEEHLKDKQERYKNKIDKYKKELTELLAQYKIVKSMSLEDLRKMMAKKTFARGMILTAIGSVIHGIGAGVGSKYDYCWNTVRPFYYY